MGIGELLRLVLATAVTWSLGLYLAHVVLDGLRTGAIRHSDVRRRCRRADNPAGFWALVVLFSLYVAGCAVCWLMAVVNILS